MFYKTLQGSLWATFFLFFLTFSLFAKDQEEIYQPDYLYIESLVKKALQLNLHQSPYWHTLLHYKKGLFGIRSLVDDPKFFLAPQGKYSPKKELIATIHAFFKKPNPNKLHPGLKFIARFYWLSKILEIKPQKLPLLFNEHFDDFFNQSQIEKMILVFPAGYINSPASMFGHTLLIFEGKDKNRILSLAINYAAKTDESFGPTFAFKGIFGLYSGFYSILKYSDKVNEYNHSEMRDMWEYTLNFSLEEIKQALRHVIEMENIASDYYFIDENCSYNLLFLLEAARPNLSLTSQFTLTTEPIDTIRVVINKGLIEKKELRPSLYNQIVFKSRFVLKEEEKAIINYAKNRITFEQLNQTLTKENKSMAYELGADVLKFLLIKEQISLPNYQDKFLTLLKARSQEKKKQDFSFETPPSPDLSHLSSKLSFFFGNQFDQNYLQLRGRFTYHELIDSHLGLSKNSEIVFLTPSVRYYLDSKKFVFQEMDLLKITSLPSISPFFYPKSFYIHAGFSRTPAPLKQETLGGFLNLFGGFTGGCDFLDFFILLGLENRFSSQYKTSTFVSAGAKTGLIFSPFNFFKLVSNIDLLFNPYGEKTQIFRFSTQGRFLLGSRFQLVGEYAFEKIFTKSCKQYLGKIEFFF